MKVNKPNKKINKITKPFFKKNVNFSNPWHGSSDPKHQICTNHEAQFLINQILKDKIKKKKNFNYTKGFKK
jgi:hypothetical protein